MTWTLARAGTTWTVQPGDVPRETVLLADGVEVARARADFWSDVTLGEDPVRVKVSWGPRSTITAVRLLPDDGGSPLPFVPPPGSRPARREALARDHPVRFTLQRVALAVGEVLLGILGVSALLTALLPRIDLSWIPRPDVPHWLRYLDPGYWLSRLPWPDWSLPDLPDLLPDWLADSSRYWLPVVIAVLVALGEIDRRRRQDARRRGEDPDETDGAPDAPEA